MIRVRTPCHLDWRLGAAKRRMQMDIISPLQASLRRSAYIRLRMAE